MPLPTLPRPLKGIVPPLVTPLLSSGELDAAGLEKLVEHVLAGGVHGLFILGTTGEGPSLEYRLRREVIDRVSSQVDSRVPVLVAVTDTSYAESMRLAEHAATSGADAVVMAPPYYFHASQSDLLRLVERFCDDTPLPLYLYNMPGLTKLQYEPSTVAIVAELPMVYGLKDSSGDLEYLRQVLEATRHKPEFAVLAGPEELLVESMELGAHGGVNGGANLYPELFVALYDACVAKDFESIAELRRQVLALGATLYFGGEPESSYLRGLKCALSVAGLCSEYPAWPFVAAEREQREAIEEALRVYTSR